MSQDLEAVFGQMDETPAAEAMPESAVPARKRSRRFLLGLVFGVGLLLGWLVIGWWLWPVEWVNSNPWHLAPQYQRVYVGMVAEEYWRTSDVFWAKEALSGWDRQDLAGLLMNMQAESADPATRRRLTALQEALEMPGPDASLVTVLLRHQGLVLTLALGIALLLAALALVVYPLLREHNQQPGESLTLPGQPGQELEESLADAQIEPSENQAAPPVPRERQGQSSDEEEMSKEQEPAEASTVLRDLMSLFEEEDTSVAALEVMCRDLSDISIDELLDNAGRLASQLQKSNVFRATADRNVSSL